MALTAGTHVGPYEIVAPIGSGGMGEVYRARDSRLGRDVAIKVLPAAFSADPNRLQRFEQEARASAALNHPNILAVHDIGQHGGAPYIVSELLDGETLQTRLGRGPLEVPALVDLAVALADALDAAHGRGIVHRDIKPANIFLTARGPKILDFGLAKINAAAEAGVSHEVTRSAGARLTNPGVTVGTIAYMSPEQLCGEDLDGRSDLFSLGLVLYEMATGRPAFDGPTSAVISAGILSRAPVAPRTLRPELPERLETIVLTALEKDRELRCQAASELRADLRRLKRAIDSDPKSAAAPRRSDVVEAGDVRLKPDTTRDVETGPSSSDTQIVVALVRRHRGGLAVTTAVVALALAGGIYVVVQRRAQSAPVAGAAATASAPSIADLQIAQLTTSGNATTPAISPDGKYVAYVQQPEQPGSGASLWIRQVVTPSNVQIVGAEPGINITGVTVTPDGSFVDFVRSPRRNEAALWRVPFLGGMPKRLIDTVLSPVGWSPDGRYLAFLRPGERDGSRDLVVAGADGSGERLAATRQRPAAFRYGGDVAPVTTGPAWSADGTLIGLPGWDERAGALIPQVVIVDPASGSQRAIALSPPSPVGVAWLDRQWMLVNRPAEQGGPLQLWRLAYPDGQLSRLTNDLTSYVGTSVTSDGGSLVTARSETHMSIAIGDGAGNDPKEIDAFVVSRPSDADVIWAADRLLYTKSANGPLSIWSVLPGGGRPEESIARARYPAATSNGKTIVFQSIDPGTYGGLWRVDADGRNRAQLVSGLTQRPVVTPDDGRVIFDANRSGVQSPWIVSIDGGEPTQVVNLPAAGLGLSPDGKSIVFSSGSQFIVCDLPACASRQNLPGGGGRPKWMSDGRAVAYIGPSSNIWVQPLDGRPPRQLTHFTDNRQIADFAWSRDGKRLAIARATTTNDIVLIKGLKR